MKKTLQIAAALLLTSGVAAQAADININVSTPGSSYTLNNGVIVSYGPTQPTGTGVIDPFLRIETPTSGAGLERGINTSLSPNNGQGQILNDQAGTQWTHDLALSSLAQVTIGQGRYYAFLLDADQVSNNPLTVHTVRFYVGAQVTSVGQFNTQGNGFLATILGGNTPQNYTMFDPLDTTYNGDTVDNLIVSGQNGSGSGDLWMYVPIERITGSGYFYLFNENGVSPYPANDGFEEWAALTGNVPEASTTLTLLGLALVAVEGLRRKLSV